MDSISTHDLAQSVVDAVNLYKEALASDAWTGIDRKAQQEQQQPEYDEGMRVYSQPLDIPYLQEGFTTLDQGLCLVSSFYYNIGLLYLQLKEDNDADRYFSKALNLRLRATGSTTDPTPIVAILHNIGYLHYRNQRLTLAMKTFEHALKVSTSINKYLHPSTVASLNCLGVIFLRGQNHEQISIAHLSLTEAILIRSKLPSVDEDANYATILNNLGRSHFLRFEFNDALHFYEQARSIRSRLLGAQHIDVVATKFNMAQVHQKLGNFKAAIELYLEFVGSTKSFYSSSSSDIAYAYRSVAEIYQEAKELENSIEFYYKALECFKLSVGEKSIEVSNVLNKIGNILYETQDLDTALAVYEQGLMIERQTCGPLHDSNMIITLMNTVRIYLSQKRWDEALVPCAEVLYIQRLQNCPNQIDIASTLCSMAFIKEKQGEMTQAIDSYMAALQIRRKALGEEHFDVSSIMNALGLIYFKMSRWKEALNKFKECLRIRRSSQRSTSKNISTILFNTAAVHAESGNFQESIVHYKECIEFERSEPTTKISDILSTFNRLGNVYKGLDDNRSALNTYLDALTICRNKTENMYDISRFFSQVGTCYAHLGEHDNAVSAFDSASKCRSVAGLTNETDLTKDIYTMYYLTYAKATSSYAAAA